MVLDTVCYCPQKSGILASTFKGKIGHVTIEREGCEVCGNVETRGTDFGEYTSGLGTVTEQQAANEQAYPVVEIHTILSTNLAMSLSGESSHLHGNRRQKGRQSRASSRRRNQQIESQPVSSFFFSLASSIKY